MVSFCPLFRKTEILSLEWLTVELVSFPLQVKFKGLLWRRSKASHCFPTKTPILQQLSEFLSEETKEKTHRRVLHLEKHSWWMHSSNYHLTSPLFSYFCTCCLCFYCCLLLFCPNLSGQMWKLSDSNVQNHEGTHDTVFYKQLLCWLVTSIVVQYFDENGGGGLPRGRSGGCFQSKSFWKTAGNRSSVL